MVATEPRGRGMVFGGTAGANGAARAAGASVAAGASGASGAASHTWEDALAAAPTKEAEGPGVEDLEVLKLEVILLEAMALDVRALLYRT